MQITVGANNIEGLLVGNQYLSVPSFQRSYSWTRVQVEQFLKDVIEGASSDDSHFYGPVVILRLPSDPKNLQIVDGQQRITTVIMALAILRDLAASFENRFLYEGTPAMHDVHQVIRSSLFLPPTLTVPRFTASYQIEAIFQNAVVSDPGPNRPVLTVGGAGLTPADTRATREMRRAYLQIREEFKKQLDDIKGDEKRKEFLMAAYRSLTGNFEIHTMELVDEDEAYVLFETLNDRGLRLNPSDLLKTLTLREIRSKGNPQMMAGALAQWDQMVQNLGEYEFSKFLRHYLLTVTKGPVQASKIYGLFKQLIEGFGRHGASKNLTDLLAASESYSRLLGEQQHPDTEIRAGITRMNSYSDTHRVLLLAAPRSDVSEPSLRKLFRAVEYLSFRWIAAGWNAQVLENFYQTEAQKLIKNPTNGGIDEVVEDIISKAPNNTDLEALTTNDSWALQVYILRRIEEWFGGHLSWSNSVTLEHLAPQNPGQNGVYWYPQVGSPDEPDRNGLFYDDYVRKWGNLTLLEQKLNSSIGNAPWQKKVQGDPGSKYEGLNASNFNLNQKLVQAGDWNLALISDRNQWLHDSALELVGPNWVRTGKVTLARWAP
jgi:hypothetical protein